MTQNGKGDAPRNCFSDWFRDNYDGIDWGKQKPVKKGRPRKKKCQGK